METGKNNAGNLIGAGFWFACVKIFQMAQMVCERNGRVGKGFGKRHFFLLRLNSITAVQECDARIAE